MTTEIGAPAPDFSLPANGGETVSLDDLKGKAVVLYFYPKDDTPGCTKEAIGFTEKAAEFAAAGAIVLGVSKDSVAKHEKFITKHDLGIKLLSDEESDVTERYGSWVEKNMYGKKYMGIDRSTFLIDGEGVLRREWRKVKVPGHVDEVLEAVKAL
ncbi:MAG: thioredoxin-dependent thiol peroxidase [Rubricella sp.]